MKRIAGLIFSAIVLSGCANIATQKSSTGLFESKSVSIVPTGRVDLQSLSNTVGAGFGALGVLLEHALTEGSRAEAIKKISLDLNDDHLMDFAVNAVKSNISSFGNVRSIQVQPRTLRDQEFVKVFNPDQRNDLTTLVSYSSDIIIEVGIESVLVSKTLMGSDASAVIGIRVIDPSSGKAVARARAFRVGLSAEKIPVSEAHPQYSKEVRLAFERAVSGATMDAIKKITN